MNKEEKKEKHDKQVGQTLTATRSPLHLANQTSPYLGIDNQNGVMTLLSVKNVLKVSTKLSMKECFLLQILTLSPPLADALHHVDLFGDCSLHQKRQP